MYTKKKIYTILYALASTMTIPLMAASFEVQPLPNELKSRMIEVGIWKPGCPVEIDRLRLVQFIHYDFLGKQQQGQIVVLELLQKE